MKRIFLPMLFCSLSVLATAQTQSFKITLNIPQYKSGIAFLTYYNGKNFNIEDSAAVNSQGVAVFQGKRKLPGGIYSIFLPGKTKYADLFIDKEQVLSVKMDSTDLVNKMVVTGSKEDALFRDYQKYVAVKGKAWQDAKEAFDRATTKADSVKAEADYNKYNKELNDYRENIIKSQPQTMLATVLNAMKEPPILHSKPVTHSDSLENYYYYKKHYWDGVTFMDERVIRTPFFVPKWEKYYRDIVIQHPDTIIKELDYQLLLARTCPEMYKFILNWSTDEYINPKYMGLDKVYVHLFEKYHGPGLTNWLNEKQMETIKRRYYMVVSSILGSPAPELDMLDTAGKPTSLYALKSDYTVVVFWDPNCGHCKEEVPRLDSFYKASWKAKGLKVFAVLSGDSKEDVKPAWMKFIHDKGLDDWTNVYQTKEMEDADVAAGKPSFRQLYDVIMTPTVFLLDKDKKIIAKKLNLNQIDELLQHQAKTSKTK